MAQSFLRLYRMAEESLDEAGRLSELFQAGAHYAQQVRGGGRHKAGTRRAAVHGKAFTPRMSVVYRGRAQGLW